MKNNKNTKKQNINTNNQNVPFDMTENCIKVCMRVFNDAKMNKFGSDYDCTDKLGFVCGPDGEIIAPAKMLIASTLTATIYHNVFNKIKGKEFGTNSCDIADQHNMAVAVNYVRCMLNSLDRQKKIDWKTVMPALMSCFEDSDYDKIPQKVEAKLPELVHSMTVGMASVLIAVNHTNNFGK